MNDTRAPELPTPLTRGRKKRRQKREAGTGAVIERSDGRWEGRLELPGGRTRSFYAKTQKEATARLNAAVEAMKSGAPVPDQRLTVGIFLERWLAGLPGTNLKPSTVEYYQRYVKNHLLSSDLARQALTRLQPADLDELYRTKLAGGLSKTTVHHLHAVIHRALGKAHREGAVARNVADLVDPPGMARKEMHVLADAQPRRFLSAVQGERLEALFVVAITAGLRQGELLGLRWKDVDLTRGLLAVRGSLQGATRATLAIGTPKTGRSRAVALGPQAVTALREHRARQVQEQELANGEWQARDMVFCTELGDYLSASVLNRVLNRVLRDAELPHIRFYDLRHSAATLMLTHGVHPKVVSEMLGHSSVAVTLDLYSHATETLQRAAADKVGAALAGMLD